MPLKMTSAQYFFFTSVASLFQKWWVFKLLGWMQNLKQRMWDHETLFADRYLKDEHFY
jgi:hypothetical protein